MQPAKRITVEDRERGIFKFLASLEDKGRGAPVKEIWTVVSDQIGDVVTQQAYYKVLDRLVAVGKLDVANDADTEGRRYLLAPHLHADTGLTLDDVYEMLEELAPSEAIARVIDARDYFEEQRTTTLKRAAVELLEEEPIELILTMLEEKLVQLRADLEVFRNQELTGREVEARFDLQLRDLQSIVYRYLGLSHDAVNIAKTEEIKLGRANVDFDPAKMRQELKMRVFGERFIVPIDVSNARGSDTWVRMTVAGSDGSTHASVMQLTSAQPFLDDVGHQVVTFNNSVVYVDTAPTLRQSKNPIQFPYYSVPMTRSAIDDKSNRGMVLAPFMFRYLSESEYEHMAKCATDVVQWRADAQVFLGTARSISDGVLLPRPGVHFRDGTITPQEREWGHYKRRNEYGDMVQEGVAQSRKVLEKIMSADSPPVFAGAVKSTQLRFFSGVINWYIARGSRRRLGAAIDPQWDTTRAAHIADNEAMSYLLSTLEDRRPDGTFFVTCAVMRPFHTLTEYYKQPARPDYDWVQHFDRSRRSEQKAYEDGLVTELPYLSSVADLEDENYVFMCRNADYVSFYVGHTAGDPPPMAPRYEFLESLRSLGGADTATERVKRNVRNIVVALDRTKFAQDRDHNFLSKKSLVKIIPFVIFEAHEKCKAIGRQLEAELRSIVVANLQGLKNARSVKDGDVKFKPITLRRFVERFARSVEEDRKKDPEKGDR
jgi:hypothetical protein